MAKIARELSCPVLIPYQDLWHSCRVAGFAIRVTSEAKTRIFSITFSIKQGGSWNLSKYLSGYYAIAEIWI
jgi:hypothetical protein